MNEEIPSTLQEYIDSIEDLDISYMKLHLPGAIYAPKRGRVSMVPITSLFNKYRDVLSSIILEIELDEIERARYMYKPKMVSEELYGTAEFWDTLLILNGFKSTSTFVPKVLKFYDPRKLKSYISEMMIIEEIE